MLLTRKIDDQQAIDSIRFLRDHIEYLADLNDVPASKRKRYAQGAYDDSIFQINVFISDLEKREVTYPQASRIAMYLEFRKRNLILTGDHSPAIRSQIHQLDDLFDYFNSNQGI